MNCWQTGITPEGELQTRCVMVTGYINELSGEFSAWTGNRGELSECTTLKSHQAVAGAAAFI